MSKESTLRLIRAEDDFAEARVEARVADQPASVAELCAVIESVIKGEKPPETFVPSRPKLLRFS